MYLKGARGLQEPKNPTGQPHEVQRLLWETWLKATGGIVRNVRVVHRKALRNLGRQKRLTTKMLSVGVNEAANDLSTSFVEGLASTLASFHPFIYL